MTEELWLPITLATYRTHSASTETDVIGWLTKTDQRHTHTVAAHGLCLSPQRSCCSCRLSLPNLAQSQYIYKVYRKWSVVLQLQRGQKGVLNGSWRICFYLFKKSPIRPRKMNDDDHILWKPWISHGDQSRRAGQRLECFCEYIVFYKVDKAPAEAQLCSAQLRSSPVF